MHWFNVSHFILQPTSFNESRRLALALYSTSFCAVVLIPVNCVCVTALILLQLDFAQEDSPDSVLAIRAFGLFFVATMILLPVCVPVITALVNELRYPERFNNGLPHTPASVRFTISSMPEALVVQEIKDAEIRALREENMLLKSRLNDSGENKGSKGSDGRPENPVSASTRVLFASDLTYRCSSVWLVARSPQAASVCPFWRNTRR